MQPETNHAPIETDELAPPLTIPAELWEVLPFDQKVLYRRAQLLLDVLVEQAPLGLLQLVEQSELSIEDVLFALKTLDGMNLVAMGLDGQQLLVRLIAVPEEHVRVTGPDGTARWLFVARPLEEPLVDPAVLN